MLTKIFSSYGTVKNSLAIIFLLGIFIASRETTDSEKTKEGFLFTMEGAKKNGVSLSLLRAPTNAESTWAMH